MRTILVWLDTAAPLIALLIGLFAMRSGLLKKNALWLIYYLFTSFLLNGICNIISEFYLINNHFIYHTENILNFIFLSYFFSELKVFARYKNLVKTVMVTFVLMAITFKLVMQNLFSFDSFGFAVSSAVFTMYSFGYYRSLMIDQKGEDLLKLPDFWYVTGILFYYASCFLIFILYSHYAQPGINFGLLWWFQNIMLSIMSLFLIKGFLCRASRTSPSLLLLPVVLFFCYAYS